MNEESFKSWLNAYGRAWETLDPDAAAHLFAEDATYQETPFVNPMVGRQAIFNYWEEVVVRAQSEPRFGAEILALSGDTGIARWWATFTRKKNGAKIKLDGIFLLRFNDTNLCQTLREWWVKEERPSPGR